MKKTILLILVFFQICFTEKITISFAGDVLLAGVSGIRAIRFGMDYPLKKVSSIFKEDDLTLVNLECALTGTVMTRNVPIGGRRYFIFKAPPKLAQVLTEGGVDIVNLANNHSMNGGAKGILETMETLKKANIYYCGAGKNFSEAHQPTIVEKKNVKIAFLGYNDIGSGSASPNKPGLASAKDWTQLQTDIKKAKEKATLIIVSFHWGNELQQLPTQRQISLARLAADAGADIVVGHHPHCLQPVETYKGKTIAYSLGNFVFDNTKPLCSRTMILQVTIDNQTKEQKIKKIPCYIIRSQPTPQ